MNDHTITASYDEMFKQSYEDAGYRMNGAEERTGVVKNPTVAEAILIAAHMLTAAISEHAMLTKLSGQDVKDGLDNLALALEHSNERQN